MYIKPEVTRYSGKELLDLMGPVETGYCDIPDGWRECGSVTMSIPLCMEDPDYIFIGLGDSVWRANLNEPGVTVKDGVATLSEEEFCIPAGDYEMKFGFGMEVTGAPDETCVSCVQDITIVPLDITYTGTAAGDIDRYDGAQYCLEGGVTWKRSKNIQFLW